MKRLLLVAVVLMAIVAGGAYLAFTYPGVIARAALEYWAPDVVGGAVSVEDIQISARTGRGAVRGLEIGNPAGFTSKRAVRFGEIRLAIDPYTLTDQVIVIHEIVVEAPLVTYERADKGSNLDAIQRVIDGYARRAGAKEAGGKGGDSRRRFVIERLEIRGARVLMTNTKLRGQGLTVELPDVLLRDMGKGRGGVTASEAAAQLAAALQVKIAQKALTDAQLLRSGGVEGVVDALRGLLK